MPLKLLFLYAKTPQIMEYNASFQALNYCVLSTILHLFPKRNSSCDIMYRGRFCVHSQKTKNFMRNLMFATFGKLQHWVISRGNKQSMPNNANKGETKP